MSHAAHQTWFHGNAGKKMVNCSKCGAAVKAEKAFCHNCGGSMNPAPVQPLTGMTDFGATMIEPPPRTYAPPYVAEVQRSQAETAHMSDPGGVNALPAPPPAALPLQKRESSALAIIGFILLLLFLMLVAFVLALWLD